MIELTVEGATCGGCVKSIEKAISQVTGVETVAFDLESKQARIEGNADQQLVIDAIEMAGFDVVENN